MRAFRYTYLVLIIISFTIVLNALLYPFTPIQSRAVNVTEVMFMNSGIIVWGYWDNSTSVHSVGLFTSGFSYDDVGKSFRLYFREYPDPDITCLKLLKKREAIK